MLGVIELLDVQSIVLKFYEGTLVIVDITIIRGTEYSDDSWEVGLSIPFVHFVSLDLGLMGSDYR